MGLKCFALIEHNTILFSAAVVAMSASPALSPCDNEYSFAHSSGSLLGRFVPFLVTTQVDSRYTLNSQRKVGRAFLPDPEALESQPGMADLPRLPE
jgi:hypothetical protein